MSHSKKNYEDTKFPWIERNRIKLVQRNKSRKTNIPYKRRGCSVSNKRVKETSIKLKLRENLNRSSLQTTDCDKKLKRMKEYLDSKNKDLKSPQFQQILNSVFESCGGNYSNQFHVKSMDLVAKKSNRYPYKGTLPSGHRGDLVKVRNGHGTFTPFPSS